MEGAHDDGDDEPREGLIDFGAGVTGRFYGWAPDRTIQSNAERYAGVPDLEKAGMSFNHPRPDTGRRCGGFVTFDSPTARVVFPDHARWVVHSWEPLTLTPSLLCKACGRHGYITDGHWRDC